MKATDILEGKHGTAAEIGNYIGSNPDAVDYNINPAMKILNYFVDWVSGSSAAASLLVITGKVSIPDWMNNNAAIIPGIIIAVPFAMYQGVRAYSMLQKTLDEKRIREQELRKQKHEIDKMIDGQTIYRTAVKLNKKQLKEFNELEDIQRKEKEDFFKGINKDINP